MGSQTEEGNSQWKEILYQEDDTDTTGHRDGNRGNSKRGVEVRQRTLTEVKNEWTKGETIFGGQE